MEPEVSLLNSRVPATCPYPIIIVIVVTIIVFLWTFSLHILCIVTFAGYSVRLVHCNQRPETHRLFDV